VSTFRIDADNNLTAHASLLAGADESQSFSSAKELAKLTADWPASRLVDTWNSFAGVAPFRRTEAGEEVRHPQGKAAVARIWQAVARLSPGRCATGGACRARQGESEEVPGQANTAHASAKGATESRTNKKAEVIAMMKRAKGVTLAEIVEAAGWQKHTVRDSGLEASIALSRPPGLPDNVNEEVIEPEFMPRANQKLRNKRNDPLINKYLSRRSRKNEPTPASARDSGSET
jgi:hypothetical protein